MRWGMNGGTMANDDLSDMTESMSEVMSLGGDVQKLRAYYKDWAKTYDDDVASHGYGLPSMMVHTVEAALTALAGDDGRIDRSVRVLDAGCGTGLIGSALCDAGFDDIHGVDLSHEMAEQAARRSAYVTIQSGIDLSSECPEHLRRSADIVTVGGVFTVGHIPPSALTAMAQLPVAGGLLVISTRAAYLEDTDFCDVLQGLVDGGALRLLLREEDAPYTMDSNGDYWAFEVN